MDYQGLYLLYNNAWLNKWQEIKAFCKHFDKIKSYTEKTRFRRAVCEKMKNLHAINDKLNAIVKEWENERHVV